MYGLINRSFQNFLADTYGAEMWGRVADRAELAHVEFEAMLAYDDAVTDQILDAAAVELDKPREAVLEDVGTYLVSHPNAQSLRRLLRFGGEDFIEFLLSLDDLPERARLAVPDLEMPELTLFEHTHRKFRLDISSRHRIFGHVLLGLLRAMADDYGALVFMEHEGRRGEVEHVTIDVFETDFSEGNSFDLGGGMSEPKRA